MLAGRLAAVDYVDAGVPAPDRSWGGEDYLAAYQAIATNQLPLPSVADEQGKAVIERISNADNLAFIENDSLPMQARAQSAMQLFGGLNQFMAHYAANLYSGQDLGYETALVMAQVLRGSAEMLLLTNEMLKNLPKDHTYETRMQGVAQMKDGLMNIVNGTLIVLTEREYFDPEDMSIIIVALQEKLPIFMEHFTPSFQMEILLKLQKLKPDFEGQDAERIGAMITLLQAKAPAEDAPAK